jgi:hypothetical protein
MVIAVDFDGTVVEHKYPNIGLERYKAIETLRALKNAGHVIIIWTCRFDDDLDVVEDWFKEKGFMPDGFNVNPSTFPYPTRKIYADVYFDDRSFPPFPGWEEVSKVFLG